MSERHRVLVIGLDGMSQEALAAVTGRGAVPALASLLDGSVSGVLESTVPPFTCPAWPTMCTGVGPGRHGVFSFIHRDPKEGRDGARIVASSDMHAPRFWQLAAEAGRRAAVLYVPTMYPADHVEPLFVSGFPGPDRPDVGAVYPPEAEPPLRRAIPEFQESNIHMQIRSQPGETPEAARLRSIREHAEAEARRVRSTFDFAARERLDLAMVVFSYPDRVFHPYYGCVVTEGDDVPADHLALRDAIDAGFRRIDGAIGHLLETFGEPATVLVVSDHGFTRKRGAFYVGECLRQAGLLKPAGLRYLLSRLTRRGRVDDAAANLLAEDPWIDPSINWRKTKVFAAHDHERGLFVNLAGRGPTGVVAADEYDDVLDRAREAVVAVRDPETGERPVRSARRREEVYAGPYVDRAPDLVLEMESGWHLRRKLASRRRGRIPLRRADGVMGIHHPDGILLASGSAVRSGAVLERAHLADVAATVLALAGLAPAEPLDGRVLDEVVDVPSDRVTVEHAAPAGSERSGYSAEDEAEVARRLEDLGYL
ncbi:MAG: alkaline phosphatase family protein [Phycisphaerae bacterium]